MIASRWMLALLLGCHAAAKPSTPPASDEPLVGAEPSPSANLPPLVPGTSVRLTPPEGFTKADTFTGFQHLETGASIMVMEMPGPFAEAVRAFDSEPRLNAQGMRILESAERKQGTEAGRLLFVEQRVSDVTVRKWIWAFGNADATVMVMGTCVEQHCPAQLDSLLAAVVSTVWDREAAADPLADLGYALQHDGGLRFAARMTNLLLYTESGQTQAGPNGVAFMIGPALGSGPIPERRAFVEARARQLPLDELEIESIEPVSIDGLDGYEIVGTSQDDGVEQLAYVAIVFEESNYWIAYGRAPQSKRTEWLKTFRAMAKSLAREKK